MIVHSLLSPYRLANNYLIELEAGIFIGVDVGNIDIEKITSIVEAKNGKLIAYFLTHAHGDHSVGIQAMWDLYKMPIFCSASAAVDINNPRKNFSIYSDEIPTFNYDLPFTIVEDEEEISFGSNTFKILLTPGHSPGCIVILYKEVAFTGDFIMADYKTPLTLPNSSKSDYKNSFDAFKSFINNKKLLFYPGHGSKFSDIPDY